MHSVLENDKETVDNGKLLKEAINEGLSMFTPDLMFEQLVKNYSMAKNIYGKTLLRQLTGYEPDYVEKNINIPEFQKELQMRIDNNVERLKDGKLLEKDGSISEKGIKLASLILYTEEMDNIIPKGILGEKIHKKSFIYGDKGNVKAYKRSDRYRDIAIKKSVKLAVRRSHKKLSENDLKTFERQSKGQICIIYGIDASGSMKGKKIEVCKKAGIALAYKAIDEKDSVGLVVFGSEIEDVVYPTKDFSQFIHAIVKIRAKKQTDIALTIEKAIEMFPRDNVTKHLVLITDAAPTVGTDPGKDTLTLVERAAAYGITISVVGIELGKEGTELARKIVEIGNGRLYVVKDLENLDR